MRTKLLKKLRRDAETEVQIMTPPHSYYMEISTGIPHESSIHIVNDAPKSYVNGMIKELKMNYIRYRINNMRVNKKRKNKPESSSHLIELRFPKFGVIYVPYTNTYINLYKNINFWNRFWLNIFFGIKVIKK